MGKTSCQVKDRYNRNHYDQILIRTGNGGRAAIQAIAEAHGMSVAAYIRHLVIKDANAAGLHEAAALIGGGGGDLKTFVGDCMRLSIRDQLLL